MNKKQKKTLVRILLAAGLFVVILVLEKTELLPMLAIRLLYLIPYLIVGFDVLKKAVIGIFHGQVFDENFLMTLATAAAIGLGETTESVAVMLFYQVGELFQSVAAAKSRRNIAALMDIRPDVANVMVDGELTQVDPEDVAIGTVITVKPGEKIPIDGVVESGSSFLDTVALTGESVPREVGTGDAVISGCVNQTGLLTIRTTKEFGESTVMKILDLVENSSMKKAKTENFITKFAHWYTPIVCIAALLLAVLPPVVRAASGLSPDIATWVIRACTFLVISCPCALVISIPLSFFGGIGGASDRGILIKGGSYLEVLAKTRTLVFDKTGTLTKGVFTVTEIVPAPGMGREALLRTAAFAESFSTHPIARSIRSCYGGDIEEALIRDVEETPGGGIRAVVEGKPVLVGNRRLMEENRITNLIRADRPGSEVHVAVNGQYAGLLLISDEVKEGAAEAMDRLAAAGVKKTVMLTGDNEASAAYIAKQMGISEYKAGLLPTQKVEIVEGLIGKQEPNAALAFVGDGINDAPVLARADIGIAMGALGSDAAIEAADVVLMDDDPRKIALAIRIARKTLRIAYENVIFAIGVKILFLGFGALGFIGMWWAIFADVGVMILAVLNAMRALRMPAH